MAGKQIREVLSPPDADRFYDLYHAVTEEVLVRSLALINYCQIAKMYASKFPEFALNAETAAHLEMFTVFAKEFDSALRAFYWHKPTEDWKQNRVLNLKRFAPYDEAAWDHMFLQMISILQPFLQPARRHWETASANLPKEASHLDSIKSWLMKMDQYLDDLTRICDDPQEIESFVRFHPKHG